MECCYEYLLRVLLSETRRVLCVYECVLDDVEGEGKKFQKKSSFSVSERNVACTDGGGGI